MSGQKQSDVHASYNAETDSVTITGIPLIKIVAMIDALHSHDCSGPCSLSGLIGGMGINPFDIDIARKFFLMELVESITSSLTIHELFGK